MLQENGVDEFGTHPNIWRMFRYFEKFLVCGKFSPSSGDSGGIASNSFYAANKQNQRVLYRLAPTPLNASIMERLHPNDAAMLKSLKGKTDPDFGFRSGLLPAYGMATLQNGNHKFPTAAVLAFPNYVGHRHSDSLDLQIFAENVPMTPDMGYPESASADDPSRAAYFCNTLAHNTVVVDCKRQANAHATLKRFDCYDSFAKRVVVDNPGCYPGLTKYQRSLISCETAPGKTVYFDVFRITGGSRHDWFMHGNGDVFKSDVSFSAPRQGTLAGEDVKQGDFYDSPVHKAMRGTSRNFGNYKGSGYQYLLNPSEGASFPGCHVSFPSHDNGDSFSPRKGALLKLFLLEGDSQTIASSPIAKKFYLGENFTL